MEVLAGGGAAGAGSGPKGTRGAMELPDLAQGPSIPAFVPGQAAAAAMFEEPLWAEVYAAGCGDIGDAISLEQARLFHDSVLAQNPARRSDRLSLRRLRLGPAALGCLAMQIKGRTYTRLDLSDNQLGNQGMLAVRNVVKALPRLTWLVLSGNLIGLPGVRELADQLKENSILTGLILGSSSMETRGRGFRPNTFGVDGLRVLLEAVASNPASRLTALSVCNTGLTAEAGKILANFLEGNTVLQHLDVSSNPLASEGVSALLPACCQLASVSLADTGCRTELVLGQLCNFLQHARSLVRISLASNSIEMRSLRRLSRALSRSESLISIDLSGTGIGTDGAVAVSESLLAAPVQTITELDLSDNKINQVEGVIALAHVAARSVLQVLRLNRNNIGDAGCRELADTLDPALCPACCLQHLELQECWISTPGATHLFECLAQNNIIRVLNLSDNFIDDSLDVALVEGLVQVHQLVLTGNRLSHNFLQRAGQACARNAQATRDQRPKSLRAEMHRLLFQETKLDEARQKMADDQVELAERSRATEKAKEDLKQLQSQEAEVQRHILREIHQEERDLEAQRKVFDEVGQDLQDTAMRYEELKRELKAELKRREQELADIQAEADEVARLLERRKAEHPKDVENMKLRIREATEEAEKLNRIAKDRRVALSDLQDKSLIDFKP
mmetsp:Transcript_76037/g.180971  ORF Transcript_76037/g.180971 Transcript_76037/m.180971 type:complete len:677 (+) Transcript_76037:52-2082(+)